MKARFWLSVGKFLHFFSNLRIVDWQGIGLFIYLFIYLFIGFLIFPIFFKNVLHLQYIHWGVQFKHSSNQIDTLEWKYELFFNDALTYAEFFFYTGEIHGVVISSCRKSEHWNLGVENFLQVEIIVIDKQSLRGS